jgi:hypothetical protein
VADGDWTELTIINRDNDSERVDVFEFSENPLRLIIKSDRQKIAARLAYALAATCGGTLYNHPEGPAIMLDELLPRVGDFDLRTALMRVRTVDDYDTGFVCKACRKWFADGDVKRWDTRWTEADAAGERTLIEILNECPLCGQMRGYVPSESVFRGVWLGKP